jgi:hypothetical protein
LTSLRPITNQDGFSAIADLSAIERSQTERIRMVLTAGADIGAVETVSHNPERYKVRSELREYLSSVVDKQFKTDATAKDRARLDQLVSAALAPHPREHAEIVLHTLEPIRETEGFTSMVTLTEIGNEYDGRVVRRVMNAGAAVKAVAPDVKMDDRYYIRPALYETLLSIRATAPESAAFGYDRARFECVQERPAIDSGALRTARPELPIERRRPELQNPMQALPRHQPLTQAERAELSTHYRNELLSAIGLISGLVDQRLKTPESRAAMLEAWKALDTHSKKKETLGTMLRQFQNMQDRDLSEVYSRLVSEIGGDDRKRSLLEAVDSQIRNNDLVLYMLMPETHLIDYLIEELEGAAQADDGLQHGEQALKDQLKYVREGLGELNLSIPRSWDEIRHRVAMKSGNNMPNFLNKPNQRREDLSDDTDV